MGDVSTFLVGGYQHSHRDGPADHPAAAMAAAAEAALHDAGVDPGDVDVLGCVEPISWNYADLGAAVAEIFGLPGTVEHAWVPAGGTSPQDLLHQIGPRIAAGEIHCAVLCGAESMRTRRRAARSGETLDWPERATDVNPMRGQGPFTSELERAHGLRAPIQLFPLFENALRSAHGRSADEQRHVAAALLAANARVAAGNPHAWFQDAPTAQEIEAVSPDNRMIVYPYTKRMNAIMDVDQCAAIIVASGSFLEKRGLLERSAAILGGAGAEEIWNPIERNSFTTCPAMALAFETALGRAGVAADELDAMDLYSCFPSAIELALEALEIQADRPLTLTGGLAFAGGPGNAYVLHALAAAHDRIRAQSDAKLLVTGIGMANTKHAATVLTGAAHVPSGATGEMTYREPRDERPKPVDPHPEGPSEIRTWTIEYDRDGAPASCILLLDLDDGSRTIANLREPVADAGELLRADPIGRRGHVAHDAEANRNFFRFDP